MFRSRLSALVMTGSVSTLIFLGATVNMGAWASEAISQEIAGQVLRFAPPSGYCLLNQRFSPGSNLTQRVAAAPSPPDRPLAIFVACGELSLWQSGGISSFSDFGMLLVPVGGASGVVSGDCDRERFVDRMVRVINRDVRGETAGATRAQIRNELEAFEVGEIKWTGVLDHDAKAAYAGFVGMEGAGWASLAGISAVTVVDGLPVYLTMVSPITDNRAFPRLLAVQRANIQQLIALNAPESCERDDFAFGGGGIDRPTWYDHRGWADLGPRTLFFLAFGLLLLGLAFWLRDAA